MFLLCNSSPITSPTQPTETKNSPQPPQETVSKNPRVFDLDMEYEKRRLLSELHQAWKEFDPLQSNLARINQQLEVLAQNPPSINNGGERPALKVDATTLVPSGSSACGQIELKSCVKSITITENAHFIIEFFTLGVTVDSLNAAFSPDEPISYKAAAVICTFPLGVLKESARRQRDAAATRTPPKLQQALYANAPLFNPPLPEWKLTAMERLGFGVLNKVVLFFDRFFWDKSQRSFGCVSDSSEKRGELFLFWSITERPCLIALVAGRSALDLEQTADTAGATTSANCGKTSRGGGSSGSTLSAPVGTGSATSSSSSHLKEPLVALAMTKLRKIFRRDASGDLDSGKSVPDPIDAHVTRWQSDVNSRGSYSYVAVGATGEDYDLLAEPLSLADTGSEAGQEAPESRSLFFHPTTPA
ncbi:unnamed protein product, partial [Dibothriocephalus latus]